MHAGPAPVVAAVVAPDVSEEAAPAPGPAAPNLPALPGLSFLGLPPLPEQGLPYVVGTAPALAPMAPAGGPLPAMDHGDNSGAPAISAALAPVYSAALTSFAVRLLCCWRRILSLPPAVEHAACLSA